jgi:hypothetical protein
MSKAHSHSQIFVFGKTKVNLRQLVFFNCKLIKRVDSFLEVSRAIKHSAENIVLEECLAQKEPATSMGESYTRPFVSFGEQMTSQSPTAVVRVLEIQEPSGLDDLFPHLDLDEVFPVLPENSEHLCAWPFGSSDETLSYRAF